MNGSSLNVVKDVKPQVAGLLDRNMHKRPRANSLQEGLSQTNFLQISTNSQMSTTWREHLIELAKIRYRDFLITIFAESTCVEKDASRRYYFEPIALLDPQSVVCQSHGLLHQDYVHFTIQMWNSQLHSKVLKYLQTNFSGVREENVSIMPYEKIQLSFTETGPVHSFEVMTKPTSYERQNESLDFYFLCDSLSTATTLARDFRLHPNFSLKSFPLQLQCRGLVLRNSTKLLELMDRPSFTFNVSTFPAGSYITFISQFRIKFFKMFTLFSRERSG